MDKSFRVRAVLICIVLLLCGCGGQSSQQPSSGSEGREDEEVREDEEGLIRVGFSQPGAESGWRVAHTNQVLQAFSKEKGYKLLYADARNRQENQIKDVRSFILQGVDYIIIAPLVETGWDAVLSEAKEAGIPVIISDRMVDVEDSSLYTAYVGSDFEEEGDKAISFLERYLKLSHRAGEPFNIVHIQGTTGSSPQKGRTEALVEACERNENWNIIAWDVGDFTRASGYQAMKNIFNEVTSSSIDLIYCENDDMAIGALGALRERGLSFGGWGDDDIIIVSFDATRNALAECLAGDINLVVECNPLQGQYLFDTIEALRMGESVRKHTYVEESFFIADSLTEEFIEGREY